MREGRAITPKTDLRIVGFDLGHAETALTLINDPQRDDDPVKLDLPCALGEKYVTVTVVAEHPDGILIGYPAVNEPGVHPLHIAFKSPDLAKDSVAKPIKLFVRQMRAELLETGQLPGRRATRWVFGVPSGWGEPVVRRYAALLSSAGLKDVEVVRESRAAMLYARDSGEIGVQASRVQASRLAGAVLVVDLGSSTTDFTCVVGFKIRPVDSGTQLGAGLIDKAIVSWLLESHPKRQELERWLEEAPSEDARLELACRKAKEDYFRNEAASHDRGSRGVQGARFYRPVSTDGDGAYLEITTADMDRILAIPHPVLGGKSWPEAFRADLEAAAAVGLGGKPDVVLLTGGASRMPFVRRFAREMFGDDRVVMGAEPDLAIARGLALAGRTGVRAAGFRSDMTDLLASEQVRGLVEGRMGELGNALGKAVATGFVDRYARPAFDRWQSGEITTLAAFENEVATTARAAVADPRNEAILTTISEWQNTMHPDLAELTRPICYRWRIPPSAMELEAVTLGDRDWDLSMSLSEVMAAQAGKLAAWVVGIIVGAFVALLMGATAATGVGFVVFGILGITASASGASDLAKEKIKVVELPLWVRRRFSPAKAFRDATAKERDLAINVANQITTDGADVIVAQVSRRLETELRDLAAEAEMLIS